MQLSATVYLSQSYTIQMSWGHKSLAKKSKMKNIIFWNLDSERSDEASG